MLQMQDAIPIQGRAIPAVRIRRLLMSLAIVSTACLFVYLLLRSRHWEYDHDTPLLQYCGFLMHRYGWMPYRDFFETSMPGTFLFHDAVVSLFGTGSLAFIVINDAILALLLLASYSWMRPLSRPAALLFVGWYGAFYLASGPSSIMQRDWLAMLPMVSAFAVMANSRAADGATRIGTSFIVGSLIGVCACFKPHLSLGGIPIVIGLGLLNGPAGLQPGSRVTRKFVLRTALTALFGFVTPLALVIAWLAYRNSLDSFLWMVHNYLPLHIQQAGDHQFLQPAERLRYVLMNAPQLSRMWPMALAAVFGFFLIDRQLIKEPRNRVLFRIACSVLAIYGFEPALSGQFWEYHYFPFQYWLLAILSLLAIPILNDPRKVALPELLLISCVGFSFWRHHVFHAGPAEHGVVADMVKTLEKNVPAGVPVQPWDWSTGAVQALLRTQHPPGTRFLYDYHFYHHVQTPTIQNLQAEFVAQLVACRVPFVLMVRRSYQDVMSGANTSDHFDAFDRVLSERYKSVYEGESYLLLRLNQSYATAPASIVESGTPCLSRIATAGVPHSFH